MTTFAETYIKPQRLKIPLYTGIKTCKTLLDRNQRDRRDEWHISMIINVKRQRIWKLLIKLFIVFCNQWSELLCRFVFKMSAFRCHMCVAARDEHDQCVILMRQLGSGPVAPVLKRKMDIILVRHFEHKLIGLL